MKKLSLSGWAAVAEIVGTLGVIISLFFLIRSIDFNSQVVQANNDNLIYQLQDSHMGEIMASPELSEIAKKALAGEELDDLQAFRWTMYLNRFLNMWELNYIRHEDGLMPDDSWEMWNRSATGTFTSLVPIAQWEEIREFSHPRFRDHVDQVVFNSKP